MTEPLGVGPSQCGEVWDHVPRLAEQLRCHIVLGPAWPTLSPFPWMCKPCGPVYQIPPISQVPLTLAVASSAAPGPLQSWPLCKDLGLTAAPHRPVTVVHFPFSPASVGWTWARKWDAAPQGSQVDLVGALTRPLFVRNQECLDCHRDGCRLAPPWSVLGVMLPRGLDEKPWS